MSWSANQFMMVMLMVGVVCKADMIIGKNPSRLQKATQWALFVFIMAVCGFSLDRGWPTRREDLDNFVFISGVVQEPTKDDPGHIFVWVRIKDDPTKPFSVEVPYNEELARKIHIANMQSVLKGEMSVPDAEMQKEQMNYTPKQHHERIAI